jgi:hypothetical protein
MNLWLCRAFKSVVFVVDGVEGFLKAAKQTLLYNILDALTSSQVQVTGAQGLESCAAFSETNSMPFW